MVRQQKNCHQYIQVLIVKLNRITLFPPHRYPDENGAIKCKNDGMAPSWLHNKYASQSTCCTTHFSWSYHACMGTKPASSYKWYVDWATSTCKQDCETTAGGSCGGLVAGAWVLLHDSLEKCCQVHVSWKLNSCLGL